jgi:2-iminobutanoate/2-iminopropanoate deaminase
LALLFSLFGPDAAAASAAILDGQVRQIFKLINATLEKAGGKLSDMVQMTVFITDVRYGDRLTQIRREIFGDDFPGSALITVTALAIPEAKVEIQGYAVIGNK